ncbi:MAG: amidase [Rubrivivax sp.]|nr:amidase [Rubrivivax sp.]MBK7263975.1 amidase [Rubrivivax sp.]
MILARADSVDLVGAHESVASGRNSASGLLAHALQAADSPACANAFIRRFDSSARASAAAVDELQRHGAPLPPLAGLAVSIKDLFDIAGQPSTGGSASMHDAPAARDDSPAVARLRAAGAALIGHTNLSEFAFSGVGINPHHGTPVNAGTLALDPQVRAPGGSTSGGATSVAAGAAWAALGSDTGGSIRIPAALQGLVGFKNTQRLTPLAGCIPLSGTLDTSCVITRTVRDAVLLHEILAARRVTLRVRPLRLLRLAVPTAVMLNDLEPAVVTAFDAALQVLRDGGAVIDEIELPALRQLATLNAQGGFAAAESWAWHRQRLDRLGEQYDPRVAARIRRGQAIGAADYIDLLQARAAWIADVDDTIAGYDALLSPTVPMQAPPVAPLLASDDAFFATNARLLRNPSVVNFFDGCALSLPCHAAGQLPVGLMVWGTALSDDAVLSTSLTIESALASTGITKA